jgi:hypothetical protein
MNVHVDACTGRNAGVAERTDVINSHSHIREGAATTEAKIHGC